MKENRRLTALELAILGMIHESPKTGYDLCKIFETTPMGHYSSSPGSTYPALKRLEARGVISGAVNRETSLRPRKLYEVTPEGTQHLIARLSEPVTRDELVMSEDETLLRFAFMGNVVGLSVVISFLESLIKEADALVKEFEAHYQSMTTNGQPPGKAPTPRLALGYGIESCRGLADWARRTLEDLS